MSRWSRYSESASALPPNPFYGRLAPFLPEEGVALDLGYGVGTGLLWWIERGWQVVGHDLDPRMTSDFLATHGPLPGITLTEGHFYAASGGPYDCICFVFALFFQESSEEFTQTWNHLLGLLNPGGILAGQLLGPDDSWAGGNGPSPVITHTQAEVEELLSPFDVLLLDEVNRPGKTVFGEPKNWHVYHIIAQKA